MISTIFEYGSEMVEVRVNQTNCLFRTVSTNGGFVPIEGIKLEKAGCVKEHPDLKNDLEWKEKAIKRFKQKLKDYSTEKQRMNYIISDLTKHGYLPRYMQQEGHRVVKIKNG